MSFSSQVKEELIELKMWDIKSALSQEKQLDRLYVREAFIKSGFINNPNKEYHLEILFKELKDIERINKILFEEGIQSKITNKNSDYMLYIKDGEDISSFLALIGANNAVIKFEEIRVMRETRNSINRIVNCETANLNKTIDASVKQIEDIKFLKRKKEYDKLSENLKEIAEIRLKNPDASYEELGKKLSNPLGKSGVSHRLKKLSVIVKEIRDGDNCPKS